MQHALKEVPVASYSVPSGLVNADGEWFYQENLNRGSGVRSLGMEVDWSAAGSAEQPTAAPDEQERSSILDLFRN